MVKLVPCSSCEHMVSIHARSCPNCGASFADKHCCCSCRYCDYDLESNDYCCTKAHCEVQGNDDACPGYEEQSDD